MITDLSKWQHINALHKQYNLTLQQAENVVEMAAALAISSGRSPAHVELDLIRSILKAREK